MKLLHKNLAMALLIFSGFVFPGPTFATGLVNLGTAENFAIFAKTGISINGITTVAGDIGVSPATASSIIGFDPHMDASNKFSTSAFVNGKLYAADYATTVAATLAAAVNDMETAYAEAASRPIPTALGRSGGDIGGLTFTPGLYKWNTGVTVNSDITLSGGAEDVWIFQVAENLDVAPAVKVIFPNGEQAKNVFWQVAGQTTIGANAAFAGNILGQTAIILKNGATLGGRVLSQTTVILDTNTINKPGSSPVPLPPAVPVIPAGTSTPAVSVASSPVAVSSSTAPSAQALQAQLDTLLATLQTLMAQAKSAGISVPSEARQFIKSSRNFTQNLSLGSKGSEVSNLQLFLIEKNVGADAKALVAVGATGHFGLLTKRALIEFQKSVGITPASGYFGSKTINFINSL